jgi:CCR4-NOT transcriptional complex subunit CAF120
VSSCKASIPFHAISPFRTRLTHHLLAVYSFMTTFGHKLQPPASSTQFSQSSPSPPPQDKPQRQEKVQPESIAASSQQTLSALSVRDPASSTPPRSRTEWSSSRPGSMIYQPPLMDTNKDTLPELLPIFTFLNSHANKLYQEGYFLRLNDLDISEPSLEMPGFGKC